VVGVVFNRVLGILSAADFKPFVRWLCIDGFFAVSLGVSQLVRRQLRR
jgi:hypothetical protein